MFFTANCVPCLWARELSLTLVRGHSKACVLAINQLQLNNHSSFVVFLRLHEWLTFARLENKERSWNVAMVHLAFDFEQSPKDGFARQKRSHTISKREHEFVDHHNSILTLFPIRQSQYRCIDVVPNVNHFCRHCFAIFAVLYKEWIKWVLDPVTANKMIFSVEQSSQEANRGCPRKEKSTWRVKLQWDPCAWNAWRV